MIQICVRIMIVWRWALILSLCSGDRLTVLIGQYEQGQSIDFRKSLIRGVPIITGTANMVADLKSVNKTAKSSPPEVMPIGTHRPIYES